jgi:hypothetical protein
MPAAERRQLRRFFSSLSRRYGPFADFLSWEFARLATETWWTAQAASSSALTEGSKRRNGKGRRPSLHAIDRRLKRQGLGVGTLMQVLDRLEQLARPSKRVTTPADLVARLRAGGGS